MAMMMSLLSRTSSVYIFSTPIGVLGGVNRRLLSKVMHIPDLALEERDVLGNVHLQLAARAIKIGIENLVCGIAYLHKSVAG